MGGKHFVFAMAVPLLVAACVQHAKVEPSPSLDVLVFKPYPKRVPGTWALVVSADRLDGQPVELASPHCMLHQYGVSAGRAFSESAATTLEGVVDALRVLDVPLTSEQLAESGFAGQVVVEVQEFSAAVDADQVRVEPDDIEELARWLEDEGGWLDTVVDGIRAADDSEELARWLLGDGVDLVVAELLQVDDAETMMVMRAEVDLAATVTALGSEGVLVFQAVGGRGAGVALEYCNLAINALEDATERAMEDVLQGIGGAFANSSQVRRRSAD